MAIVLTDRDWSSSGSETSQTSLTEQDLQTSGSMPSLASTETDSDDSLDIDFKHELVFANQARGKLGTNSDPDTDLDCEEIFADSVINGCDSDLVSVTSGDRTTSSNNNVSLLRGSLQQLEVNSSPRRVMVEGRSDPIPAPDAEFFVDDGWMVGRDLESYNAWVENNQLAIEAESANNDEQNHQ